MLTWETIEELPRAEIEEVSVSPFIRALWAVWFGWLIGAWLFFRALLP